jgi:tetratricopeptide (TPR) repeat protein
VAQDQWDSFNHLALGRTFSLLRRFDEAQAELELAIELNPSLAQAYFALGFSHTHSGRERDALPLFEKAVGLSPRDPHLWTFHHLRAMAHFRLDEMAEAESFVRKSVRLPYAPYWPFATLTAILASIGRTEDARAIADRLVKMKPGYSLVHARQDFFFAQADGFVDRYVEALAEAGIE